MSNDAQEQHARFWKKYLRLTRGRVTVLRALAVIAEEERAGSFFAIVKELLVTVEGGSPLSEGLVKHPDVFSPSVRELVRTAEKTGAWDEILVEIAEGLQDGTFS